MVIKGFVLARQFIIGFEEIKTDRGIKCMIKMYKEIHLTESHPRRAFQWWRYLEDNAVPKDLPSSIKKLDIPAKLRAELSDLGLL